MLAGISKKMCAPLSCISSSWMIAYLRTTAKAKRRAVEFSRPCQESMLGAAARSLKASISKPVAENEREGRPSPCQH
jgi:hypothetical protein